MIGMDSKKENLAASPRFSFCPRPAIMVRPERETPGISASDWAKPTSNDFFQVSSFKPSVCSAYLSASQKSRATRISAAAITIIAGRPLCRY